MNYIFIYILSELCTGSVLSCLSDSIESEVSKTWVFLAKQILIYFSISLALQKILSLFSIQNIKMLQITLGLFIWLQNMRVQYVLLYVCMWCCQHPREETIHAKLTKHNLHHASGSPVNDFQSKAQLHFSCRVQHALTASTQWAADSPIALSHFPLLC